MRHFILDRYLLLQFVRVYIICFVSLAGLFVIFDAFANLDEFMRYADGGVELLGLLGEYYGFRLIYLFQLIAGNVSLISAMFTLTWIQMHNEFTAILAAGIPARRVLLPVIGMVVLLSFGTIAVRELVIPQLKDELKKTPNNLQGEKARKIDPRRDNYTEILLRAERAYTAGKRLQNPSFILPKRLAGSSTFLVAEEAAYLEANEHHNAGYLLKKIQEPAGFTKRSSLVLKRQEEERVIVYTPKDYGWLKPDEVFVESGLSFEQFTQGAAWRQFSSTHEMMQSLNNPSLDFGGNVRVSIHARILQPLMDFVLLMLGLPFAVQTRNRNVFLAIGICIVIIATFLGVTIACHWLGATSIFSAAFAAWLPLMLFGPLGCWLSYKIWN